MAVGGGGRRRGGIRSRARREDGAALAPSRRDQAKRVSAKSQSVLRPSTISSTALVAVSRHSSA